MRQRRRAGESTTKSRFYKKFQCRRLLLIVAIAVLVVVANNTRVIRYLYQSYQFDVDSSLLNTGMDYVDPRAFLENLWPGSEQSAVASKATSAYVTYSMSRYSSYNMTFSQANKCNLGVSTNKWGRKPKWREPLLGALQPLLNFTTMVETPLNILFMGDSVAIQFGQLLEEALGAVADSRAVIHNSWAGNEGVTIASTEGGGAIALYRLTGMFLARGEGQPLPNAAGGGWNKSHVEEILHHPILNTTTNRPGKFDVLIFRIPHGWLQFDEITRDTLQETIQLAHDVFGVRQVLFIDIPFTNNIKTVQHLAERIEANEMIRQVADTYDGESDDDAVTRVTTLRFARWTDHLMEYNARSIGLLPPDNTFVQNKSYTLDRLGCAPKFPLSIAHGCAEMAKAGDCQCRRNRIAEDGIHWCLESVGGRLVAGIACLLSCMQQPREGLRDCEAECNDKFMSLRPPDPEMFEEG